VEQDEVSLFGMSVTSIKLDTKTRDALQSVMFPGDTYDEALQRLVKAERQRLMAAELATWEPASDERRFLDALAADASLRSPAR
jgi:hypothetical protein